jgi:hypothetical protein
MARFRSYSLIFNPSLEPSLDEAADRFRAAGLIILSGGPSVDRSPHFLRKANSRHGILPSRWTAGAFTYYVFL